MPTVPPNGKTHLCDNTNLFFIGLKLAESDKTTVSFKQTNLCRQVRGVLATGDD